MKMVLNGLFGILKAKNNPQNITVEEKKINFREFRLIYFKNITQSDGRIMHFLVEKYIL